MKRTLPLTMEARLRQARRDVLRGHNSDCIKRSLLVQNRINVLQIVAYLGFVFGSISIFSEFWHSYSGMLPLLVANSIRVVFGGGLFLPLIWLCRSEEAWLEPARRYQAGLEFLTGTYDLRAIGPLAEAYWLRNIPSSVAGALTRLLRVQNQMSVSVALDAKQSRCLYLILALPGPDEADLQIAILDFAETFGDVRALPFVRALAEDETRLPRLQAAALRCHAALQAEQALSAGRQTLLRGTHAPLSHPEQLLHPSQSSPETQPEQLLRATTHIPPQA